MSVYINSTSLISPQKTFDSTIASEGKLVHSGVRLNCIEPNYAELIDPKAIRRMSRIIRMGVAAVKTAVKKAGIEHPDAIIVGTAFGCLEDTHSFISRMTEYNEDMLNPTPFIHSTHNTIAGQIALHFKCHGYNSTYVHRSVSFESALIDGFMQVQEGAVGNALIGGTDELIDASFTIMDRMGFYRKGASELPFDLNDASGKGTVAGEGAGYFMISGKPSGDHPVQINCVEQFSHLNPEEAASQFQKISSGKYDLILSGHNGDSVNDRIIDSMTDIVAPGTASYKFKQLCGEYPTATAFALWLATEIASKQLSLSSLDASVPVDQDFKNILVINQSGGIHYSFISISA